MAGARRYSGTSVSGLSTAPRARRACPRRATARTRSGAGSTKHASLAAMAVARGRGGAQARRDELTGPIVAASVGGPGELGAASGVDGDDAALRSGHQGLGVRLEAADAGERGVEGVGER